MSAENPIHIIPRPVDITPLALDIGRHLLQSDGLNYYTLFKDVFWCLCRVFSSFANSLKIVGKFVRQLSLLVIYP